MARIFCIGDTHCHADGRNADRFASLDAIIRAGYRENAAAWVHLGDVNDARMSIEDRNELARRFQQMADLAPLVILYGNHDLPGDLAIFTRLAAKYPIQVIPTADVLELELAGGQVATVFAIPYPHRAGLVGVGVAHEELNAIARDHFEAIFLHAAAALEAAKAEGRPAFVVGHVNVAGSIASTGQPQIGREIELDAGLLGRLPNDVPIVLGHIHRHQQITIGPGAWATYAGSIARQDFGELEPKGYVAIEWHPNGTFDACQATPVWSERFVPLEVPPMYLIEGELTPTDFSYQVAGESLGSGRSLSFAGADVKVKYSHRRGEVSALDLGRIHAEFAEARSLKLEALPIVEHQIREPEIVAAPTLEAKAIAYCDRQGITVTESIRQKLDALLGRPAALVLEDVDAAITTAPPADVVVEEVV